MTQLLLFEPTNQVTSSAAMAAAAVDYARTANRTPQTGAATAVPTPTSSVVSSSMPAVATKAPAAGLNHMGDLARLVLMRYDLLAKRRAEIAARHAS